MLQILSLPYKLFIAPPLFLLNLILSVLRLFLLSPILYLLRLLTLPLRLLSSQSLRAVTFALEIGGGYRDIFIFLATAAVLGLAAGTLLYGVSYFALSALRLSPSSRLHPHPHPQQPSHSSSSSAKKTGAGERTAVSYRREREVKRARDEKDGREKLMRAWEERNREVEGRAFGAAAGGNAGAGAGAGGVRGQTIVEEDDSDY